MEPSEVQISATISRVTKDLMERHVRATGVKRGYLIEQAIRHHLLALQEIPLDAVSFPKIVVTKESGVAILSSLDAGQARRPNAALRRLMADGD